MIIGPCTIVTGGPEPHVLEDGAVRIVGAHVAHVGLAGNLAATYPNETLWAAHGRVLVPGVVNTHAHLARSLARGLGLRTPADWRRYDHALAPEDVQWAVRAALAEGLRHGVTTVCDFHRSDACTELSLTEVVAAAREVGVRLATCYGVSEHDTPAERKAALHESATFAREIGRQRDGRFQALMGVHATSLAGLEALSGAALEAGGGRVGLHVDLALDLTPAERWGGRLAKAGPATLWAHADTAPRDLVDAARERGDTLAAVTSGAAPHVRDAELAWGSDSAVNAPPLGDVPAASGPRAELHYRRLFANGPRWASALFGEGLGTIAPGAPADLVLLDYRPATELSSRTIVEHLFTGLLRAPVTGVMVSGEIVMNEGRLTNVDEAEVAKRARECAKRVWKKMG